MKKKTALVTGASRGIGKAIALRLAGAGYNIIINCSSSAKELMQTKCEIEKLGCTCLSYIGDIGIYENAAALFEMIDNNFGGTDILINNAGISYIGLLTDMTPDDWNTIVRTNLTSVFNCCRLAVPHMIHNKSGKIVNISSVWGSVGASCEVAYSATKGGINAFTKALAKELAPSNIQVNAVSCGAIDTAMNNFLSEDEMKSLIEEIPAGRLGQPKEVADLVYEICHNNLYLTGQIIHLDGGWI